MTKTDLIESILRNYPRPYLTNAELEVLLNGTPDSRYGKVKRLLAAGKLLHLRRGLYGLTNVLGYQTKPHPYELAQYIYGPSYISLESALCFHKLIPEGVFTVTSVTGRRASEFHTPLGVFSYLHLPPQSLYTEVELIQEGSYRFLMAKPWKAICDYIYCYKKAWHTVKPLLESLRIEEDSLPELTVEEAHLLNDYYNSARISRFLKGMRR